MNKKAALNLGISTVVVLVIAMVVIGAGVSFIRTFFDLGTKSLEDAFPVDDSWGTIPDRTNPFVIARGSFDIPQRTNSETSIQLRFYNREASAIDVNIATPITCVNSKVLTVSSLGATNIEPGTMVTIPAIITNPGADANGPSAGNTICQIKATTGTSGPEYTVQTEVRVTN